IRTLLDKYLGDDDVVPGTIQRKLSTDALVAHNIAR
ncbi:MAG: hypothetical protein JWQ82_1253, partial [Tardiphaga sp.]|nr:hypothetical protein [Tardiphaga sp.]